MNRSLILRLTIALIGFNCIAFGVNYFGISPKIQAVSERETFEIFLFTDREPGTKSSLSQVGGFLQDQDGFWPFESFYTKTSKGIDQYTGRFRGFFTGFLLSEFVFYNLIILALLVFLKLW